jgi:hypothetical protein
VNEKNKSKRETEIGRKKGRRSQEGRKGEKPIRE